MSEYITIVAEALGTDGRLYMVKQTFQSESLDGLTVRTDFAEQGLRRCLQRHMEKQGVWTENALPIETWAAVEYLPHQDGEAEQ